MISRGIEQSRNAPLNNELLQVRKIASSLDIIALIDERFVEQVEAG